MNTKSGLYTFLLIILATFLIFLGWLLKDSYWSQPVLTFDNLKTELNSEKAETELQKRRDAWIARTDSLLLANGDSILVQNSNLKAELAAQLQVAQKQGIAYLENTDLVTQGSEPKELTKAQKFKLKILIIIAAGLLGGFARTRYKYLDEDLIQAVDELDSQTQEANQQIKEVKERLNNPEQKESLTHDQEDMKQAMEKDLDKVKNNFDNLHHKITKIKEKRQSSELNHSMVANLVFGLIASSLSILALDFINSKVLDFNSNNDYFILWGWCILGAVFAKAWIQNLYDKIRSQTENGGGS